MKQLDIISIYAELKPPKPSSTPLPFVRMNNQNGNKNKRCALGSLSCMYAGKVQTNLEHRFHCLCQPKYQTLTGKRANWDLQVSKGSCMNWVKSKDNVKPKFQFVRIFFVEKLLKSSSLVIADNGYFPICVLKLTPLYCRKKKNLAWVTSLHWPFHHSGFWLDSRANNYDLGHIQLANWASTMKLCGPHCRASNRLHIGHQTQQQSAVDGRAAATKTSESAGSMAYWFNRSVEPLVQ